MMPRTLGDSCIIGGCATLVRSSSVHFCADADLYTALHCTCQLALQKEEPTPDSSSESDSTEAPAPAAAGSSSLSEPDDFPEHGLVMSYQSPSSSAMQTPAEVAQRVLPLLLYHPPTYRYLCMYSHYTLQVYVPRVQALFKQLCGRCARSLFVSAVCLAAMSFFVETSHSSCNNQRIVRTALVCYQAATAVEIVPATVTMALTPEQLSNALTHLLVAFVFAISVHTDFT
jgi:hypothetical protein